MQIYAQENPVLPTEPERRDHYQDKSKKNPS